MRLLLLAALSTTARTIDLNWIPADGAGPLPLSAAYRAHLGRLCDLIESGAALPPSIVERLADIEVFCAKLRKSERSLAPRGLLRGFTTAASLAVGGGYAWHNYQNRGWIYKVVRDNQRRRRASITGAGSSLRYGQYATMTPKPKYKKPHDL